MNVREKEPVEALAAGDGHASGGAGRRRHPRGQGSRVVTVALVAVAVGASGLYVALRPEGSAGDASASAATRRTGTATVTRQDLVARTEVDGTLGYAGDLAVVNHLQGTVTAIPADGTVVERGQALYWVNNRPVPLLYGDLPMWRGLALGTTDGPDVRQLEQNLVALGYATESELGVDERFTSATAAAVRRWQAALGVEQTGSVDLGEAAFLPEAVRIAGVNVQKGSAAPPGAPVLEVTTTARSVEIDLDATRQSLVNVGDKVDVKLPDGRTTPGTITSVGTVARMTGQGESAKRVVEVRVSLDDPGATGTIDQAPVKVAITSDSRTAVLAVPVNALLALAEGGYGVRVVDVSGAGTGRVVAVETGLFARGMVEIRGDGISEGTTVEVPAS